MYCDYARMNVMCCDYVRFQTVTVHTQLLAVIEVAHGHVDCLVACFLK